MNRLRRAALVATIAAALAATACGVDEQVDFLVGRRCIRDIPEECDPGQACLPHAWLGGSTFSDYRCRDEASFFTPDAPLAYCSDADPCPGGLVCNADRVRIDASVRPRVCKTPEDLFAPPFDGGV